MEKKIEKRFDCLAFKYRAQQRIARETKGMTPDELIEYYRKGVENGPFARLWKELTERDKKAAARRARQTLRKSS